MIIQKCWRWHLWWKSLVKRATVCRLKMQVVWSKSVCIARNLVGRIYGWCLYILFEKKMTFEIFAGLTWEPPSVQRVPSLWKERGGCRRRATRTRCQAATDRLMMMMMMLSWWWGSRWSDEDDDEDLYCEDDDETSSQASCYASLKLRLTHSLTHWLTDEGKV